MPKQTAQKKPPTGGTTAQAIKELKAFYHRGRECLRDNPPPLSKEEKAQQRKPGESLDAFHKARALAGAYSAAQFAKLIEQCKEQNYPIARQTLINLLPLKPTDRKKYLDRAIRGQWSSHRLQDELLQRFGKHRIGAGRKIKPPADANRAIGLIRNFGERWRRVYAALRDIEGSSLPKNMSTSFAKVDRAVGVLLGITGDSVRGDVINNDSGDLVVEITPLHPAAPDRKILLRIETHDYKAHFKQGRLVSLQRGRAKTNQLGKVLQNWFGDKVGKTQIAHRVRFFRDASGWSMAALKPNQHARRAASKG